MTSPARRASGEAKTKLVPRVPDYGVSMAAGRAGEKYVDVGVAYVSASGVITITLNCQVTNVVAPSEGGFEGKLFLNKITKRKEKEDE